MLKCNICSKDAEYIYRLRENGKKFDIKIDGEKHEGQLYGHVFLCGYHYKDALKENW